ncbi:hypothetical protein FO519_010182 [Halicephalobus sp. NKZ332]|nr:hypothetical protein FO519_010182 [Halicephalobus sp. NKZ332]
MKLFILAALFGLSSAVCDFTDCHSCAGQSAISLILPGTCYWDLAKNKCAFAPTDTLNIGDTDVVPQALSCPAPLPAFQYTDDFGRNTAFVFAMASNAEGVENVTKCPAAKIPNVQVINQYTVNCDLLGSTCSATLFLHRGAGAVVVAFRGSKGTAQFTTEALQLVLSNPEPGTLYSGNVFAYFGNATNLLWNAGLGSDLQTYLQNNPTFQLWTFGHSLGGSLATLAANAAVRNGFITGDKVVVTTMGEPRTGDYDFASDVTNNVPQTYRIINGADLIPRMPLRTFLQNTNAYHNDFEVWYNSSMNIGSSFAVNNRADDYSGANVLTINNLLNVVNLTIHNSYFSVDMNNYVQDFCS